MKRFAIGLFALTLLLGSHANATLRYVSQTGAGAYTLPSAAHAAAVNGDTILVGPGIYVEPASVVITKRLTWIGAGWDQSIVNGLGNSGTFQFNASTATGSTIEGLRLNGGGAGQAGFYNAMTNCDSITARRCMFVGGANTNAIGWTATNGRLYLEDCVIIHNYQFVNGIEGPRSGGMLRNCVVVSNVSPSPGNAWAIGSATAATGPLEVYNSVFLNWGNIFNTATGSPASVLINNAAFDFNGATSWGTIPGASLMDFNAGPAGVAAIGTNYITIPSNPFVTYDTALNYVIGTTNLNLIGGSNLIDAGNPGILDVNGSRSDVGVYGGPRPLIDNGVPNYPWAVNIVNVPNVVGQGTPVNATAIGRVGPQ
ncbi:MAG: hypothetical protein IPG71_02795 [bacterium]|nr:hypothetical protein [bacterium]